MDIQRIRREGREHLAALTGPEIMNMGGTLAAAETGCRETLLKVEALPLTDGVLSIQAAADGLASLFVGGNDVAQTAVTHARQAGESATCAAAAYLRGILALREAAAAFQEVDEALVRTQFAVNVAAGHTNHYLTNLGTAE